MAELTIDISRVKRAYIGDHWEANGCMCGCCGTYYYASSERGKVPVIFQIDDAQVKAIVGCILANQEHIKWADEEVGVLVEVPYGEPFPNGRRAWKSYMVHYAL